MSEVFICDVIRTPIGRYGGALSTVRPDDLGALVLRELMKRNASLDPQAVGDVILGCANQAGEDNRNVARMSALLAGLPIEVPGATVNRLCGSGMDAIASGSRMILAGEADVVLAGGTESMSRAPYVVSKSATAFARDAQMFDTTIGWRFINPVLRQHYGVDSMPETAENVAADFNVSREDQDRFALRSQQRALAAQAAGLFTPEIVGVPISAKKGAMTVVSVDEHPRETSLDALAKLPSPFRVGGTVTAGNSSGVNDGACAVILAGMDAVKRQSLTPRARVIGSAVANEALDLPRLPEKIAVVGGGYIAVEFAGIFNGLGSQVDLWHRGRQILRGFDEDVRNALASAMTKQGVSIRTETGAGGSQIFEGTLWGHPQQTER
jgi:acetyl-CoA acetyltransferase family protein